MEIKEGKEEQGRRRGRELYKDFHIVELTRMNNLKQRYEAGSEFKELLIMNYVEELSQIQLDFVV